MRITESDLRRLIHEALLLELRDAPNGPVPTETKYFARPVEEGYVLYYTVGPQGEPVEIPGTFSEAYKTCAGEEWDLTPEQIRKAEELVALGLYEKSEREVSYKEIDFKYRKNRPGTASARWLTQSDVPDMHKYYLPKGAGFEYLLVDTDNKLVSLDATWTERRTRRGANTPTKTVKDKSYVIPSGDVAFVGKEVTLKKLFSHLLQVDPRVTPDYKIVSPDDKYRGQTIGQAVVVNRTTDVAVGGAKGKITAYHGTTTARWEDIEKRGMLPGKFEEDYSDQIAGYSSKNLYFTMDPHTAENYATRAAIWYGGNPLILKVEIPDITKIIPDEDSLNWFPLSREYVLTQTDRIKKDEKWDPETFGWKVTKTSEPGGKHKIGREQHFNNIMRVVRLANKSVTGEYSPRDVSKAPEAGLEWVQDDEFKALMRDIESKLMSSLAAGLTRIGTFAYRGRIPPKFIKRWKQYPKKSYPKAVDTGTGGAPNDEYQKTRQSVLDKVKRFPESLIRNAQGRRQSMPGERARATESILRKIVREEIKGSSPKARDSRRPAGAMSEGQLTPATGLGDGIEEKGTSDYYTLHVLHSKTFEIPGRNPITVPDYETSELRARVRDGAMEIVSVYVPESQRGKGLATKMVLRAAEWGRSEGLEIVSSGVYSDSGRGLARSFVDRGEASKIAARLEGAARPRAKRPLSES